MKEDLKPDFSILLVDDEKPWLRSLSRSLVGLCGFNNLILCSDSRDVIGLLQEHNIGLVLLDLTMPHRSGEDLLQQINKEFPEVLVVILSGLNQVETAVRCMHMGAYDYFVKTEKEERLIDGVRRAVQLFELQRENLTLRQNFFNAELERPEAFVSIVTRNSKMLAVFRYLESVALSRRSILILGESGVGKELVARAIHQISRATGPLISVNVAGLDDNHFADTLFGHLRGSFTGAEKDRSGMIEQAANGTLFLDEIGDLSLTSQIKLLRLLQEGEYFPVGSDKPRLLQGRIICATNQDLEARISDQSFRKDLYFRLQSHRVLIPPLRDRREDLPLLLGHFLEQAAQELSKKRPTYPKELVNLLGSYSFPGNVRELRAMVFDAVSSHQSGILSMSSFRQRIEKKATQIQTGDKSIGNPFLELDILPTFNEAKELLVDAALERSGGNQTMAANLLGIAQPSLSKRLKRRRKDKDHYS